MEKTPDDGLDNDEGFAPGHTAGKQQCGECVEDDDEETEIDGATGIEVPEYDEIPRGLRGRVIGLMVIIIREVFLGR